VLEAMACGRPIVATNVGGIPEQLVEGETGFLVPASDPEALGAAIVKVLQDPTRARIMGRNARNRAEALYAMDPFIESYEKLFATMAARRKAAA
jgi:glycosyltransferase involved in cell wall biosynthesis